MKSSIDVESGRLLLFVCCVTVTGLSSALAVGHTHTKWVSGNTSRYLVCVYWECV